MKRFFPVAAVAISLSFTTAAPIYVQLATAVYAAEDDDLFYYFGNQKIPLAVQQNAVAVSLVPETPGAPANRSESSLSRLQQDFGANVRGANTQIKPLSEKYVLLTSSGDANDGRDLRRQAKTKSYIAATLPVLNIPGKSNTLVLPNEVIISFKPDVSAAQQQSILAQNNFKSAKPIPFANGFYVVEPAQAEGLKVLSIANQLSQVAGIRSASPNFIEVKSSPSLNQLKKSKTIRLSNTQNNGVTLTGLVPGIRKLQWHIDSRPMRRELGLTGERTDVRALEAWNRGKKGDGVVVAVIDDLIQWDHPVLKDNFATVNCVVQKAQPCEPGESVGWDFARSDKDTRASDEEIARLKSDLSDSLLSNADFKSKYEQRIAQIKQDSPGYSEAEVIEFLRSTLREEASGAFHGTMAAGMIVGNANNGFRGIAPNVKILPVRVWNFESVEGRHILAGIGYAAHRGVDVINMSFGATVPIDGMEDLISDLQKEYPKIVWVAAAGNNNKSDRGYPASYPGVVSVGSINVAGNRASYSNFGQRIDVVAPGGDTNVDGGVLTLSGLGQSGFIQQYRANFAEFPDGLGYYIKTQGTSFAAPTVAGVVALMKSADPQRKLTAAQYRDILIKTSSFGGLSLSSNDLPSNAGKRFFLGNGLVNAEKAVARVEKLVR
jgi:serine protease